MSERFLRIEDVIAITGLKHAAIYDKVAAGPKHFPQPIKFGRSPRWVESEVNAWLAKKKIKPRPAAVVKAEAEKAEKHQLFFDQQSHALTGRSIRSTGEIVAAARKGMDARVSGVYFLVKGDEVVYVGQSTSVHSRVAAHFGKKDYDFWSYIPCEKEGLDILESLYIHFLQPKLNGKTGQTDQLGAPVSLDDLLKRITLREAA